MQQIRILSANLTRWSASWTGLLQAAPDLIFVQEARIPRTAVAEEAEARRRGWQLHHVHAGEEECLLATAARQGGLPIRMLDIPELPAACQGRVQLSAVHAGHKRVLLVANLYGKQRDISFNETLVLEAVAAARAMGVLPTLLLGDLNFDLGDSELRGLLGVAGWVDLLKSAGGTCYPSRGAPSRLDYALASPEAVGLISGARLRWDLGVATHGVVELDLQLLAEPPAAFRVFEPTLAGPAAQGWDLAKKAEQVQLVDELYEASMADALADEDLDKAWGEIQRGMHCYLTARMGQSLPMRRYAATEMRRPWRPAGGREGDAEHRALDQATLRVRRLENLRHGLQKKDAPWARLAQLAAQHTRRGPTEPRRCTQLDPEQLDSALTEAMSELRDTTQQLRARRRQAWWNWATAAMANDQGKLFRWLRDEPTSTPQMVPLGRPTSGACQTWVPALRGGPVAQHEFYGTAWQQLWQTAEPEGLGDGMLQSLTRLPPFPPLPRWSAALVAQTLRGMARRKRPGLDAWSVPELRALPTLLHGWLGLLLEQVESTGRWPRQAALPEGVLLPKGDGQDPLDRRPIWLMPLLYRIWSAARARPWKAWQRQWFPDRPGLGAAEAVWIAGAMGARAATLGQHQAGIAIDWSKAYDQVGLAVAERAGHCAGIPAEILAPLMAAYRGPRRIRVAGILGPEWTPARGLLPGCALACYVLNLLTCPWRFQMYMVHSSISSRVYVDDMLVQTHGTEQETQQTVEDALRATESFEASMGWKLNRGKTRIFASTRRVRQHLGKRCPQYTVGVQYVDLGVTATVGKAWRCPVAAARGKAAAARLDRVGKLPLPFAQRCRLAMASATALGTYGAGNGPPPQDVVKTLRAATKRAVCRGANRAAHEAVFGLLAPAWQLDPLAVVVIAPLHFLVRALVQEWLPRDVLHDLVAAYASGHGPPHGPLASASRSLSRLDIGGTLMSWRGIGPGGKWDPAANGVADTMHLLLLRWRLVQCRELAMRRPAFRHLQAGWDRWASTRLLRPGRLPADRQGALRTIRSGAAITEEVAAHWTGKQQCVHCGTGAETLEHRLWKCRAWEKHRLMALAEMQPPRRDVEALRRSVADGVALTGILPDHLELRAWREIRESVTVDEALHRLEVPIVAQELQAWTDGACKNPQDASIASGGWGLFARDPVTGREWRLSGPTPGRQTAPRSELMAAVVLSHMAVGGACLTTDSRHLADGIHSMDTGECQDRLINLDLWQHLERAVRDNRLRVKWMPAHLDARQAAAAGIAPEDHEGNRIADSLATAAAVSAAPPQALVLERKGALADLCAVQRVISLVQLAAVASDHQPREGGPRVRPVWRSRGRGRRPRRPAPASTAATSAPPAASTTGAQIPQPTPAPPPGLHLVVKDAAGVKCQRCGRRAPSGRWHTLVWTPCSSHPGEDAGQALLDQWRWQKVPHVTREGEGRISCIRCGGRAPRCQRANMVGRRCPAWLARAPEGSSAASAHWDWGALLCRQLGLAVAGSARRAGKQALAEPRPLPRPPARAASAPPTVRLGEAFRPRPPHSDPQSGLQWRSHAAVQGPRTVACAICGSTARGWSALAALNCRGWSPSLPPAVRALIASGLHVRAGGPAPLLAAALFERLA